jgi:FkbM family methyltransferase
MIISLDKMVKKYNMKIRGVIHIGAHYGGEYKDYVRHGIKNMMFFEPVLSNYLELVNTLPKNDKTTKTYNLALGNEVGVKEMYVETANKGMSCSLLEPCTHLKQYPHIIFDSRESVRMVKLDDVIFNKRQFNMINIDVQGYELEVFKGAVNTLPFIDIIYSEVNFEEVYKGCVHVEELDSFLKNFGFKRTLTDSSPHTWGDALYLKQK